MILMCPPDHFGVAYVINPWMEGQFAKTDAALAKRQWQALHDAIGEYAEIVLQPPQPGLPDLVFTANAGLVLGNGIIVSRFRSVERQGEETHDRAWFAEHGFEVPMAARSALRRRRRRALRPRSGTLMGRLWLSLVSLGRCALGE